MEEIGGDVYRTVGWMFDVKVQKPTGVFYRGAGARWNASDGTGQRTETDRLSLPQLSCKQLRQPIRTRVSLNELANCSRRCSLRAAALALTPAI